MRFHLFILASIVLAIGSSLSFAQSDPNVSLGDAARAAKKNKAQKAKVIVDQDSTSIHTRNIPLITNSGLDNSDEIIAAIETYRKSHTATETENEIRAWYEYQDGLLQTAIDQHKSLLMAGEITYQNPTQYRVASLQRAEDQRRDSENGLFAGRIQRSFLRIRSSLMSGGVKYAWFKVRCANDNCSF